MSPSQEETMTQSEADAAKNNAVAQAVMDRIRSATRGKIRGLEVECDGEVLTVRGAVDSSYLHRLAFNAGWFEARNAGGLLFDLQIKVIPPPQSEPDSPTG
jgi:hypothetical protein